MRPNRLRLKAIAAWLGVIALGLNALVPIHLAFDLANAIVPVHPHAEADTDHDTVRSLLTLLIVYDEDQDQPASDKRHQHSHCAVCAAVGTLAGFAPVVVAPLVVPISVDAATLTVASAAAPHPAPPTAYRARAPPVA
jgi:hypothetical protein